MKDKLGNDIQVGMRCVFSNSSSSYLYLGFIKKINPIKLTVEYADTKWNRLKRTTTKYPIDLLILEK